MDYAALVGLYERLAATDSTNEKRSLLASAFADADDQLHRLVVLVRGRLSPAYDREELGVSSSLMLAAIRRATGVGESGAVTAGFSGGAIDDSFRFRGDFDVTFRLSDHCDFTELLELVETVDPERVYTQHGFAETLATALTTRGFDATALKQNQTSLRQF